MLFRLAFWSALAAVLVLASLPQPPQVPASDKWQHVAAFFLLTGLAATAYPHAGLLRLGSRMFGFGVLIELIQLIPALNRSAEAGDLLADAAGILLAAPFIVLAKRLRARRFASAQEPC